MSAAIEQSDVEVIDQLEAVQALGHPLRVQILEALREPASAAGVARQLGQARQKVNYHLKDLARVGLVRPTGERRVGNFVETLYQAIARSYVVSPKIAWADPRRMQALNDQRSLETLVVLGERLQRDAITLLNRAAFDGEEIASASVAAEVRFESEEQRAAFLDEYLRVVGPLFERYGSPATEGVPYRVVLAAYPEKPRSEH